MAERIVIRGVVQGVGFRPTVARVAQQHDVGGFVNNNGSGVEIGLTGSSEAREAFLKDLLQSLPPLAQVEAVERKPDPGLQAQPFRINFSEGGEVRTEVAADAGMCPACSAEIMDPYERRYRYPFATCTHCGPRYSIATSVPFDRDRTTMVAFPLCSDCEAEYGNVDDRRFHAQAMACHACGPRVQLERADGRAFSVEAYTMLDAVDAAGTLLIKGEIVAIKGLGCYHLCCDATNAEAVERLRSRKRRVRKPFALMVKDLEIAERYVTFSDEEKDTLQGPVAPIVIAPLKAHFDDGVKPLASGVAPGQRTLGFMRPYTPLHQLLLRRVKHPIVCTSANLSDEPPSIDDDEARERLGGVADWFLTHNRPIHNRVDDSIVRTVSGRLRTLRRARGLAPKAEALPAGLEVAPPIFAAGGQFKSAFALVRDGQAVLSPHLGDLDHLSAFEAYGETHRLLSELYAHRPEAIVVDAHPEYRATQWARAWAERDLLPLIEVQHHHAHVAAVMAEHKYPLDAPPVLGIAIDGLGLGDNGELWGGEFLLSHFSSYRRQATIKPVALLGGDLAAKEPWRNLYAQLRAGMPWGEIEANFAGLPCIDALLAKRSPLLEQVLENPSVSPLASSGGRLFDAVAAAVGICFERIEYEGQAAIELENAIEDKQLEGALAGERYPIAIPTHPELDLPYLEFKGMWSAILGDLFAEVPPGLISARFHVALAEAIVRAAELIRKRVGDIPAAALSGGCFQNRRLLELCSEGLTKAGFQTLTPERLPAHDGGIALGQAAVGAAKLTR